MGDKIIWTCFKCDKRDETIVDRVKHWDERAALDRKNDIDEFLQDNETGLDSTKITLSMRNDDIQEGFADILSKERDDVQHAFGD